MKIWDFINDKKYLELSLNCSFEINKTKHPDWVRVFVTGSDNIQRGRLTFHKNTLYSVRNYKQDHIKSLGETDLIFNRLSRYIKDRCILDIETYNKIVIKAKKIRDDDLKEKNEWRKNNPNPKRKRKIEGKNLRRLVSNIVMGVL